jgi:hypothetical protein
VSVKRRDQNDQTRVGNSGDDRASPRHPHRKSSKYVAPRMAEVLQERLSEATEGRKVGVMTTAEITLIGNREWDIGDSWRLRIR